MAGELTGKILNGVYRVDRLIDGSGLAEVYRGQDLIAGRAIAIKALKELYSGDSIWTARLRREAEVGSGFHHPNLVTVYDYNEDYGRPYVVMELVDALNLRRWRDAYGMFSVELGMRVAIGVLNGLSYIHQQGKFHRDVKPTNILLNEALGIIKLIDYGIVKGLGDADLTSPGLIMGSPAYMSPEQARNEPIVAASDVYSAGVVLYQLLTDRLLIEGNSEQMANWHAQLAAVPRRPRQWNGELSARLDEIVMKALAKQVAERYSSAAAMQEALEAELQRMQQQRTDAAVAAEAPRIQLRNVTPPLGVLPANSSANIPSDAGSSGGEAAAPPALFDGRYAFIRLLQRDAHTEVWLAEDKLRRTATTKQSLVVKVLREDKKDDQWAAAAFEAEIGVNYALRHPNLLRPLGRGTADRRPYMVLPFVEGRTPELPQAGLKWRPQLEWVFRVGIELAGVLDYLHTQQLAHGGVALDNLLLTLRRNDRHEDQLELRLIDLGQARRIDQSGQPLALQPGESDLLTAVYEQPTSIAYWSPQRLGDTFPASLPSARADIYALGVVLHLLLTGKLPYSGATREELLRDMRVGSLSLLYQAARSLPDELVAIVVRCLAPNPADRYGSAADLLAALDKIYTALHKPPEPLDNPHLPQPLLIVSDQQDNLDFGVVRRSDAPRGLDFVVQSDADSPGTIIHEGAPWLEVSPASFAEQAKTAVRLQLDPARLPRPGTYRAAIRLAVEEELSDGRTAPVPGSPRILTSQVRLMAGVDTLLLLDTIGTAGMLEERRQLAREIIAAALRRELEWDGLRIGLIAYGARGSLAVRALGSPVPEVSMALNNLSADTSRGGLEAPLEEVLQQAIRHGWNRDGWRVLITIAGRPPYPLRPEYDHQIGSPAELDWKALATRLKRSENLLSIVVACPLYWDSVKQPLPAYALEYSAKCWRELASGAPLELNNARPDQIVDQVNAFLAGSTKSNRK